MDFLFSGAVTMARMRPACASSIAASRGRADLPQGQVGGQGGAAGDDVDVVRARRCLADVGDLDDLQPCAQLGGGAAQRARVAIHHARRVQALRVGLDDDFGTDAGGIAHGDAYGQGGVHDAGAEVVLRIWVGRRLTSRNSWAAR
jgi:hypothetical protein